ncbi:MAG: endonuclease III domain-containing protein [Candidatus Omnitrophota bacterium]
MMVGAVLTQNTSWKNVEKAILNLKAAGLLSSPRAIKKAPAASLAQVIRPAGYYNIKARRLKNLIDLISSDYGGSISAMSRSGTAELRRKVLGVNGVGPETCDSILLYAFGRPVFVIDAYTRRVFTRHGLVSEDATYEEMQELFMENLPKRAGLFNEYHALIVRTGKDFCKKRPLCGSCPLKTHKNTCK